MPFPMTPAVQGSIFVFMLVCSNVFMTFAWYAHLKNMAGAPWVVAAMTVPPGSP